MIKYLLIIIIILNIIGITGFILNKIHKESYEIKEKKVVLPPCYLGGGESEWGERDIAVNWTNSNASVLEFGGGAGSVSTIVQNIINNKKDHVVIQPPEKEMMGGITQLKKNRDACGLQFQIIDHILKEGEEDSILKMVSKPFDTIVADCENCLYNEYKKNPKLFSNIKQIQVERDDDGSYNKLRQELNMKLVHIGKGCDGNCTSEVWEK